MAHALPPDARIAAGAPPQLVAKWNRYMDALRVHEAGHLKHGRELASSFKTAALGLGAMDCRQLDGALRALRRSSRARPHA